MICQILCLQYYSDALGLSKTCAWDAAVGLGYDVSLVPLLYTLKHTMVRHTKAQTISGQSVLALPDKSEELVPGADVHTSYASCPA